MSDQAIIAQIAALISRDVVHVHTLVAPREPEPPMARSKPAEERVETAPRGRPEMPSIAETESTFQDDIDLAAQAATLTAASASGTPFCPT